MQDLGKVMFHKFMTMDTIEGGSVSRVQLQDASDQSFCVWGHTYRVRERLRIHAYFAISSLYIVSLVRWFPNEHGVDDHSKTPYIHLIGMSCLAFQYFRCYLVGSTTNGKLLL